MKIEADVHPLIAGIVSELPTDGMPMSYRRRQAWLQAFQGILALLYPEPENEKDMHEYVDCPKSGCEKCYGWRPPETTVHLGDDDQPHVGSRADCEACGPGTVKAKP